jgi:hypothetical protein
MHRNQREQAQGGAMLRWLFNPQARQQQQQAARGPQHQHHHQQPPSPGHEQLTVLVQGS